VADLSREESKRLRAELAEGLGFYPASLAAEDVARYCQQIAERKAREDAGERDGWGPGVTRIGGRSVRVSRDVNGRRRSFCFLQPPFYSWTAVRRPSAKLGRRAAPAMCLPTTASFCRCTGRRRNADGRRLVPSNLLQYA
jgi:hypothetical protein